MSTLVYDVPHLTIPVDPGPAHTAIGARLGHDMLNCAVLTPHTAGPTTLDDVTDRERELWTPTGEPADLTNLTQHDLMLNLVTRVELVFDWLVATYADPDEPVFAVVEMTAWVARGASAVTTMLCREIGRLCLERLDGEPFDTRARLHLGERHRRAPGRPAVDDCYPEGLFGWWPEWGMPARDGRPVRMLPNEDRGKRRTDVKVPRRRCRDAQTVFDLAAAYWMDDHELRALIEGRPLEQVMA